MNKLKKQVEIYAKNKQEEDEYKETLVNNLHERFGNSQVKAQINQEQPITAEELVDEVLENDR